MDVPHRFTEILEHASTFGDEQICLNLADERLKGIQLRRFLTQGLDIVCRATEPTSESAELSPLCRFITWPK